MAYKLEAFADLGHKCEVTHSTAHTLTHNTPAALAFDTESEDTDSMHDTVTNNSRITIQSAGRYAFYAEGDWSADTDGQTRRLFFRANGATEFGNLHLMLSEPGSTTQGIAVTAIRRMSVSDYVELMGHHDAGNDLDLTGARFSATKISQ